MTERILVTSSTDHSEAYADGDGGGGGSKVQGWMVDERYERLVLLFLSREQVKTTRAREWQ